MTLWWLQPGWTQTLCGSCGKKIWPEGDPDWGECFECKHSRHEEEEHYRQLERQHYEDMERWESEE